MFGIFGKNEKEIEAAIAAKDYASLPIEVIDELAKNILLTTESGPDGIRIEERLEVITAECVFGMNVFRDFFAGIRDVFGGRSAASQKILRDLRKTCLGELKREALLAGANAVIAIDLDYSEISGDDKSMLFVVASGTAVRIAEDSP